MSLNDVGPIATRPPRQIRKAEGFLAGRLEPGESVFASFQVRTASILVALAVLLGFVVLWDSAVSYLFRGHELSQGHDALMFVGLLVAVFLGVYLQKPRLLALTDRRLFILKSTPLLNRVESIEFEEGRASIHATLRSKTRVVVSGKSDRAIRVRGPSGSPLMGEYLRDWASPPRPDTKI